MAPLQPGLMLIFSVLAVFLCTTSLAQDADCPGEPTAATRLHLSDPPYENYFYSDCHSATHVVVSSPLVGSSNAISPRLLVAWPAGNSGIAALFAPANGQQGTLSIGLEDPSSYGEALQPIYEPNDSGNPRVGVSGVISFNSSAVLTVSILGSIRTIRDYTEGGGTVDPSVKQATLFGDYSEGGASVNRTWFDGKTTTWLDFVPQDGADPVKINRGDDTTLQFGEGKYQFNAAFNYPQLKQLSTSEVLNENSQGLIGENPDQTTSLSFLSYTDKLLAGTWRFLTYFGRDSMIAALLLQPVLSDGENGAIEAVIGAVLERINRTDGTVCHEEIIGDYATFLNQQRGVSSADPGCDYKMVDTDYYLPILMKSYFVDTEMGQSRASAFFQKKASFLMENDGLTYADLATFTIEKIMKTSASFADNQKKDNLIHLRDGESVGEWRDSSTGLGGGRIPYDVNTALVPAGLRAISALAGADVLPDSRGWKASADQYAKVWEDAALDFFKVSVSESDAKTFVQDYVSKSQFNGPSNVDNITSPVTFYGLALDGNNGQGVVPVMNTDDCFRLFLLNITNQDQLSSFLNQTADHILQPFPIGLSSDVGLFVANPAYANNDGYTSSFGKADYHGTVVWSWQLAMMAAGLSRQLGRCNSDDTPNFCSDEALHGKVLSAYNHLWDLIDANTAQLSTEVWSWKYDNGFKVVPISDLGSTESNIRQLWSLTFLAVHREDFGNSA